MKLLDWIKNIFGGLKVTNNGKKKIIKNKVGKNTGSIVVNNNIK